MEKVINALGKIMSYFLFLLEIITPCLLFLLPVINIIANNWRNNLESLLFLGNAVVLLMMLILLISKSWEHRNKESLDFFITDDLKGFVYKSFTLLLTLSSIVYKDNSSEEKPKVINFFS